MMIFDIMLGSLIVYMILKPLLNAQRIKYLEQDVEDLQGFSQDAPKR